MPEATKERNPVEETAQVRQLRVSYFATRTHDRLIEIGDPDTYENLFEAPRPVCGIQLQPPFATDTPTDTAFWSLLSETAIKPPAPPGNLSKMVKHAVPLRHVGALGELGGDPVLRGYLEAHVRPFGVVAYSTLDFEWQDAIPLDDAWQEVDRVATRETSVTIGTSSSTTSAIGRAAAAAADALLETLGDPGGQSWEELDHRIATVIVGEVKEPPVAMPPPAGRVRMGLHRLSLGNDALPEPNKAFVPQWASGSFGWAASDLVYVLDVGTSLLAPQPPQGARPSPSPRRRPSTQGGRHRWALLLLTHASACVGVVRGAPQTDNGFFGQWANWAAAALGRLYAPLHPGDLGLEARAFLARTGASEVVEALGRDPLAPHPAHPNLDWPAPPP